MVYTCNYLQYGVPLCLKHCSNTHFCITWCKLFFHWLFLYRRYGKFMQIPKLLLCPFETNCAKKWMALMQPIFLTQMALHIAIHFNDMEQYNTWYNIWKTYLTPECQWSFPHNSAIDENLKNGEEFRFRDEMAAIARDPDAEHLFSISHFDDFSRIEDDIVSRTCREAPPGNIIDMINFFQKKFLRGTNTSGKLKGFSEIHRDLPTASCNNILD